MNSLTRNYDDCKMDQFRGRHYAGCCEICCTEAHCYGPHPVDTGLRTWQCPTCGEWGCDSCEGVNAAYVCQGCRKRFCCSCIETVDGLKLCPDCKVTHMLDIQDGMRQELAMCRAMEFVIDAISGRAA